MNIIVTHDPMRTMIPRSAGTMKVKAPCLSCSTAKATPTAPTICKRKSATLLNVSFLSDKTGYWLAALLILLTWRRDLICSGGPPMARTVTQKVRVAV